MTESTASSGAETQELNTSSDDQDQETQKIRVLDPAGASKSFRQINQNGNWPSELRFSLSKQRSQKLDSLFSRYSITERPTRFTESTDHRAQNQNDDQRV